MYRSRNLKLKKNAKVTNKQNGYVIYHNNVSPGSFAINDFLAPVS
ncbi:TPA: fimbria/pilus outer membrane usher protein [Enterobacter cancerogenus]